jgi:hypothetical protein
VAAIAVALRDRIHAIPLIAVCLNVTWELLFAFWRPPKGGALKRTLYAAWFALDVVILVLAFVDAPRAAPAGLLRDHARGLIALGLATSLALHLVLFRLFERPYHVAFGLNLLMSLLFVDMYFARPDGLGLSLWVAWLKFGGTTSISLANVLRFGGQLSNERVLAFCMGGSFLLDIVYLSLLHGVLDIG